MKNASIRSACISFLVLALTCPASSQESGASWRPDKLETCILHPDIQQLIVNETSVWGDKGITEDIVRSLHDHCPPTEVKSHPCTKSQRILIKNGTVYLTNLMPVNGWAQGHMLPGFLMELYETSQVYKLPDVEFSYWQDDNAPAETMRRGDGTYHWAFPPHGLPPMMSWAKAKDHGVLAVPYSSAFRCPRDSFDAIMQEMETMSATPWSERSEMAFGRWNIFCAWYYRGALKLQDGTSAPCPRLYYNDLYYNHSDKLLTVALMRNLTNGTTATSVSLHQQNKYKYLVSTDGWAISSKFDKYLLLGSLLFKAEGLTYGFYYPALKPFEHYVPIMLKHKDDILDMLEWAKTHDKEARQIAEAGQRFAMRHLNRPARLCYMFQLISALSKQMRYEVRCDRRPECVPLVEEIKFLSKYDVTRERCRYQEILLQYGYDDPDGLPGETGYEELRKKHEAMPRHANFG